MCSTALHARVSTVTVLLLECNDWSIFFSCRTRHLASVAFSVVNSSRRGYPGDEGANIAISKPWGFIFGNYVNLRIFPFLGTIRRFLEHYGEEIEKVVFVTDGVEVCGFSFVMMSFTFFVCYSFLSPPTASFPPFICLSLSLCLLFFLLCHILSPPSPLPPISPSPLHTHLAPLLVSQTWYQSIMPLYFPRSKEEEAYAAKALPLELGDEFGEPIIPERKIRISDKMPVGRGKVTQQIVCVCILLSVCTFCCLCVHCVVCVYILLSVCTLCCLCVHFVVCVYILLPVYIHCVAN